MASHGRIAVDFHGRSVGVCTAKKPSSARARHAEPVGLSRSRLSHCSCLQRTETSELMALALLAERRAAAEAPCLCAAWPLFAHAIHMVSAATAFELRTLEVEAIALYNTLPGWKACHGPV